MENIKDEVLYGVSINGKKPRMWDEEYPDILNQNLNFEQLQKSVEIIRKNVTYQSGEKIRQQFPEKDWWKV